MPKDIVSDEAEFSIAINRINEYSDFLCRSMEKYIKILAEAQHYGIKDELIRSRLGNLAAQAKPAAIRIGDEKDHITESVREFISRVEEADKFEFPQDISLEIANLVAAFF